MSGVQPVNPAVFEGIHELVARAARVTASAFADTWVGILMGLTLAVMILFLVGAWMDASAARYDRKAAKAAARESEASGVPGFEVPPDVDSMRRIVDTLQRSDLTPDQRVKVEAFSQRLDAAGVDQDSPGWSPPAWWKP